MLHRSFSISNEQISWSKGDVKKFVIINNIIITTKLIWNKAELLRGSCAELWVREKSKSKYQLAKGKSGTDPKWKSAKYRNHEIECQKTNKRKRINKGKSVIIWWVEKGKRIRNAIIWIIVLLITHTQSNCSGVGGSAQCANNKLWKTTLTDTRTYTHM